MSGTKPDLFVIAVFSRHPSALDWARARLVADYGPIALESPRYHFHHTPYYTPTMGEGLQKQLLAFERLVDPARLAEIKRRTIELEEELASSGRFCEERPLNLDPGLLNLGKFMLASTKDNAQRIYLRDGIYAEVTLRFHDDAFQPWPWTYRDYQEPLVRDFLKQAREFYRKKLIGIDGAYGTPTSGRS